MKTALLVACGVLVLLAVAAVFLTMLYQGVSSP